MSDNVWLDDKTNLFVTKWNKYLGEMRMMIYNWLLTFKVKNNHCTFYLIFNDFGLA